MIKLINVSKYYYSSKGASLGLRKINLELPEKGLVAITGESGSGKSTLLNILSGLDSYEEGELYFDGKDTSGFDTNELEEYRKNNIGFVFQNYNLIESYTALDNVISAMLITEKSYKEAKVEALKLLDEVGLSKYASHKAVNLSSGQKQRLAIARALAKDTKVIIADEPTGNLDSDTGKQIIKILSKISKYKLVIVATHNYPDFEGYTNLFIRLYQGELIGVEKVKEVEEETRESLVNTDKNSFYKFIGLNYKSQPLRILFNVLFSLVCMLSVLVFSINFSINLDTSSTLIHSSNIFSNINENRIVVMYDDGFDTNSIKNVEHVVSYDSYDLANEVNYYYRENIDYGYTYALSEGNVEGATTPKKLKEVYFKDKSNFLRSSECIKNEDLACGRLPSNYNEVVLYSSDYSKLNSEILFYFQNRKNYGVFNYYGTNMVVVGILKNYTTQVYFSNSLMNSFNLASNNSVTIYSVGRKPKSRVFSTMSSVVRPIKNENLPENTIRCTAATYENLILKFEAYSYSTFGLNAKKIDEKFDVNYEINGFGEVGSEIFVEMSSDLYEIAINGAKENQISLYIDDSAYASDVMASLDTYGVYSISPYANGSTTYDEQLVKERLVTLLLSLGLVVATILLKIIITFVMSKFKKNDYVILKSMGLKNSQVNIISSIELFVNDLVGCLLGIALFFILIGFNVRYISDLYKYTRYYHILLLIAVCLLTSLITSLFFRNYISKKMKILSLRED